MRKPIKREDHRNTDEIGSEERGPDEKNEEEEKKNIKGGGKHTYTRVIRMCRENVNEDEKDEEDGLAGRGKRVC